MTNTRRVISNAAALYGRVAVTSVLGLFTSRLVLAALGIADFGIYSVIAGIMGFMAFLNGAMATSSQRHLTFELGRSDFSRLNRTFVTAFQLHAILATLLIITGETVGLWFVSHVLNIPDDRRNAVFWIFQFTAFSTAASVLSVPYQALLTAHEALAAVALFGVVQSLCTFLMALVIFHAPGDRLIFYALASATVSILVIFAQILVCRHRYPEARLQSVRSLDRPLARELLGFSGWGLFGSLSAVCRLQGLAFLLNIFFGPAVNAAFGIANQVSGLMLQVTAAFQQALAPRIVKEEGAGNRDQSVRLSLAVSKFGFFVGCLLAIPVYFESRYILTIWLVRPPENAAAFVNVMLLVFVVDQVSSGYAMTILAFGKVGLYYSVIGLIHLLTLPLAYGVIRMGGGTEMALGCAFLTMFAASMMRGVIVGKYMDYPYASWLCGVFAKGLLTAAPAVIVAWFVRTNLDASLCRLLAVALSSGAVLALCTYLYGLDVSERAYFHRVFKALAGSARLGNG